MMAYSQAQLQPSNFNNQDGQAILPQKATILSGKKREVPESLVKKPSSTETGTAPGNH